MDKVQYENYVWVEAGYFGVYCLEAFIDKGTCEKGVLHLRIFF